MQSTEMERTRRALNAAQQALADQERVTMQEALFVTIVTMCMLAALSWFFSKVL